MSSPLLIREADVSDIPFILDSWLRHYVDFRDKRMPSDHVWFKSYRPVVENLLQKCSVKVAAYSEQPHQIFGYIVYDKESPILHWIFVKKIMQEMGIATKLIDSALGKKTNFIVTHFTSDLPRLMKSRQVLFNPILLMETK